MADRSVDTTDTLEAFRTTFNSTAADVGDIADLNVQFAGTPSDLVEGVNSKAHYTGQNTIVTVGTIATGTWEATDVGVAHGGTGASTASDARTNLGVAIGSDVQAWDAQLDDIAALAVTDGNIIVGDGVNWVVESGATARASLGLTIGTDVQAYDDELTALAGLTSAADKGIQFTGSGTAATYDLTAAGKALLDDADAAAQLVTLGLTATAAEINTLDGITATTAELNYTDGVTSAIQTQLDAKAPLASPAFTGTAIGVNLTLSGDLTVNGTTTTLNTTNTVVSDNLIELNNGVSSNANDSGIVIERGSTGDNAFIGWDESADKFVVGTTTATGASTGDLTITVAPLETGALGVTGNITVSGTVDGRDVATDGSKLDGIEAGADVTDTANVTAAGALMDSEVDADIKTLSLPANTTISAFGATLVDDADAAAARTTLGVDASGTDNSTDVTLAGTPDYITISGQVITRNAIDLTTDVTGALPVANGGTGSTTDSGARTNLGLAIGTDVQAYDAGLLSIAGLTTAADNMIYTTALDTYAVTSLTSAGRALLDDADAAAQLVTLGLTATAAELNYTDGVTSNIQTQLDAIISSPLVESPSGTFTLTGDLIVSGNVTSQSDETLKENIKEIEGALEKITKLSGRTFVMKSDESKKENIGFIAQELEQHLPQVVFTDPDGIKSVSYGNVTAILVEAIKELHLTVEELKNRK